MAGPQEKQVSGSAIDAFSKGELLQYSRQLILEELGAEGQRALKNAKVLVVGAGGLGAPVLLYLAAAGVGTLGVVEFDRVEQSNLHRQVLFTTEDIGRLKLEVARERVLALNPYIQVESHAQRLDVESAREIIAGYDLVVDATDNFPSRYLINDTCVLLGKPNVSASIFRYEGQLSVFWPGRGPCYRCLYPEPPPPELAPSCAEGGVLGVLPGIVGSLQANEVIKLLLDCGTPLLGRILSIDAMTMQFSSLEVARNERCPICSKEANSQALQAYEYLCSALPSAEEPANVPVISAASLGQLLDEEASLTLLDVRNPREIELGQIPGAQSIPLDQLSSRFGELPRQGRLVCYCQTGKRSQRAVAQLLENGFENVVSLDGGIEDWSLTVNS